MSELPPLPPGFQLASSHGAMPPLPPGFEMAQPSSGVMDFIKSIPGGIVGGAKSFLHGITQEDTDHNPGYDPLKAPIERGTTAASAALPKPEGRPGMVGQAIGEGLGNPLSWVGLGGLALKAGGSILSSAGGEGARQAAEGTPYEIPAQLAGSLVGGVAAVKTAGARPLAAAVPTSQELRAAKDTGYQAARNADLVLDPKGPASWAGGVERDLTNGPKYAFTGGTNGTAPKTLEALAEAQAVPSVAGGRATVTGANLDSLRIKLGTIAGETRDFKPTPDAKAAMVAKRSLENYTENIPAGHVLAGDAKAYAAATTKANANNAAFRRTGDFEQKLTNATDATEGGIATKIDNQIKSKLRSGYLTNEKKQRGLTGDEVSAIRYANKGSLTERTLRQVGRFAPESPVALALHLSAGAGPAFATGGASIIPQIALALAASGAKHTAQAMTKSNANKAAEMLAKRSPLYKERAALTELYNQLNPTKGKNQSALVRALLAH